MRDTPGAKRRIRKGDPNLAIGFIRVSTDLDRQELGSEGQRLAQESWAAKHGVTIAATFVEEASGGAPISKRVVFAEALAALAVHGAGLFLVQRIDRFSRDSLTATLALGEIERNGAKLQVCDGGGSGDNPTEQLVRSILFAVGGFEKSMISQRIRVALQVKRGRNELVGKAPFGFRVADDGRTLEPDPRERAIQARFRELRSAGLTLRAIASCAANEGITNRAGKPFAIAAIHTLVSQTQT